MICPKCGKEAGESKFCPECGTKLDEFANQDIESVKQNDEIEEMPDNAMIESEEEKSDNTMVEFEGEISGNNSSNKNLDRRINPGLFLKEKILPWMLKYKIIIFSSVALIILIVLISFLTHKSDEVKACIENINSATENITVQSDSRIASAEKEYENLSSSDKRKVSNHGKLIEARNKCDELIAENVINRINNLTEKAELSQIQSIRISYNNLTDNQKQFVKNYSMLEKYEKSYYDGMIEDVVKKIDSITYKNGAATDEEEKAINDALEAYNKIGVEYMDKVTNYDKLKKAISNLETYKVSSVQKLIDEAIKNESGFGKAEEAYKKLPSNLREKISNYSQFTIKYDNYKNRPPVKLISYRIESNLIGNPEFYLRAENISDKIIKGFTAAVFGYDNDGVPVSLGYNDYIRIIDYDESIKVGATTQNNLCWTFYGIHDKSPIQKVVVIVKEVSYFDGTTWENMNFGSLCEKYERQIISTSDENILKKG